MVDRVQDWVPHDRIWAQKNVTINEPFFQGHFPITPIMPGVMILESLAQTAGILAYLSDNKNAEDFLFYLASVDKAKFKKPVRPGDTLNLHIKSQMSRLKFVKVIGEAFVADRLVCSAEFVSAKGI
jgi:3-hydroxyacyl-[acyl-carrier-protein] dehydratase